MYSTFEGDEFSGGRGIPSPADTFVPVAPPQPIFTRTNTKPATVGGELLSYCLCDINNKKITNSGRRYCNKTGVVPISYYSAINWVFERKSDCFSIVFSVTIMRFLCLIVAIVIAVHMVIISLTCSNSYK